MSLLAEKQREKRISDGRTDERMDNGKTTPPTILKSAEDNNLIYYILKNIDEVKCVFSFSVFFYLFIYLSLIQFMYKQ